MPIVTDDPPVDGAVGYDIGDKAINLAQLQAELANAAELAPNTINLSMTSTAEGDRALWVVPAGIDPAVVAQVVADHVPNPDWGVPEVAQKFNAIIQRLITNPDADLSDQDKEDLLRGLALYYIAVSQLGS